MSDWFRVTKRINGKLYDFLERTRTRKSVTTESKLIGPADTIAETEERFCEMPAEIEATPLERPKVTRLPPTHLLFMDKARRQRLQNNAQFNVAEITGAHEQRDYQRALEIQKERLRLIRPVTDLTPPIHRQK